MTEQNRRYVTKEIGKLLSEIWRVKSLAEQEYGQQHPITKKLASMHEDAQKLLRDGPWESGQKLFRILRQAWSGVRGIFQYRKRLPALLTPASHQTYQKALKGWASIIVVRGGVLVIVVVVNYSS